MFGSRLACNVFGGAIAVLVMAAAAQAQVNRTFVSTHGSDGNTSSNCGPLSPCRNLSAAISVLNPGGEVVVLDSGGYGNGGNTTTIAKALTIDAGNVHAAVTALAGTDAFMITAGPTDVVVLRGLSIQGANHSGGNGITIQSAGTVHVEDCQIQGFSSNGINGALSASSKLFVSGTVFRDNLHDGVFLTTSGGTANAYVSDCFFSANGNAGAEAGAGSAATIARSGAFHNGTGFMADTAGAQALLVLIECQAANNSVGLSASGANATLDFAYSTVTQNGTGLIASSGGVLVGSAPGTSVVNGNTSNGSTSGAGITLQ